MSQQEGLMLDALVEYAMLRAQRGRQGLTFIERREQGEIARWLRENTDGLRVEPRRSSVFVAVATSYALTANVLAGTIGAC
jgi:hypothetical protein